MTKILMTGGGSPGGLGIATELLKMGYSLIVADANNVFVEFFKETSLGAQCESVELIPSAKNRSDFEVYIKNLAKESGIDYILPLVTRELLNLAHIKKELQEIGCSAIVQESDTVEVLNNKWLLYKFCRVNNIDVPHTKLCKNSEEVLEAFNTYNRLDLTSVVKPVDSNGSRGVRILHNKVDLFRNLTEEKPGCLDMDISSYLKIINNRKIELMVSEYLPGKELTVDCIAKNGEIFVCLMRERIAMRSGISVAGQYVWIEKVYEYCELISKQLNIDGPFGLQFKADKDLNYKLLESNPRIQGTSCAAKILGINYPDLVIRLSKSDEITEKIYSKSRKVFWRYYQEA